MTLMRNRQETRARAVAVAGMLAATFGISLAIVPSWTPAAALATTPTFSATGVCLNGVPEFAFTLSGLPAGQKTNVTLSLFDNPNAVGTTMATVGPGIATVLWNTTSSALFRSGAHIVEVQVAGNWIPATNLTLIPNWPIPNSYSVTLPACGSGSSQAVGLAATQDGQGYWEATASGQVLAFGDAPYFGSMSGVALRKPIVGIDATPDGQGYWLVAGDGGVFAFGSAKFCGSAGGMRLDAPVVGMATTPDGLGYSLVAADGGVFSYGDAKFLGSAAEFHLSAPVVAINATSIGAYRLIGSDGGVFDFGTSVFEGSLAGIALSRPVVASDTTNDGGGYWMAGADGGIFALGDAGFFGTIVGAFTATA